MLAGWKTGSNWWEERLAVRSLYTGVAQTVHRQGRYGTSDCGTNTVAANHNTGRLVSNISFQMMETFTTIHKTISISGKESL